MLINNILGANLKSQAQANSLPRTPKQDGFYFPAEWHPHEYTIMQFVPRQNWAGYGIKQARQDWATVANTVSEFEPVLMVVDPQDRVIAKKLLSSSIELVELPLNDGWARDSAPLFVINDRGERRVTGFTFNGWGAKFPPYDDDAQLRARLCEYLQVPCYEADLVLEGGAVTLDGEGTLITTEECLLNPNRNRDKSKEQVEQILQESFNVSKVIWLSKGTIPDPITDGHVDGICVFIAPEKVMLHTTDDLSDPNYQICQDAKAKLLSESDSKERKLEIIELPLAYDVAHINFYIANGCVIVPIANDPTQDDAPLSIIRNAFSDRKVIGVSGEILAKGGGGVHCITQQVPMI
ncbi:MAG: agmatine deiminase family protein [Xenococcus sp. MO_188.B8]|nr:agmatine deiminase family protein [Xenococcus sp. MO_188.B8]